MGAAVAQNVLVSVKNFSGALNEEVISLLNLLLGMKHGSSTTSWKQRECAVIIFYLQNQASAEMVMLNLF